jgi:hypothetical protein
MTNSQDAAGTPREEEHACVRDAAVSPCETHETSKNASKTLSTSPEVAAWTAQEPHADCHDLVCNGSRQHPRGAKGVCCSCRGREERTVNEYIAMRDLLRRIRGWDVLDGTADGPYWRGEIDRVLALPSAPAPPQTTTNEEKKNDDDDLTRAERARG